MIKNIITFVPFTNANDNDRNKNFKSFADVAGHGTGKQKGKFRCGTVVE